MKNPELIKHLDTIKQKSAEVWEHPYLYWFTDHGPKHSDNIIQIADMILKAYNVELTEYEKFIFHAAAYLHDVGMQEIKNKELNGKDISAYTQDDWDLIRREHPLSSFNAILDSLRERGRDTTDYGITDSIDPDIIKLIAYISLGHSTGKYDDNETYFAHTIETYKEEDPYPLSGAARNAVRVSLLTSLLLIADELDLARGRVSHKQFTRIPLSPQNAIHYFKHHYIRNIDISKPNIIINFQFPPKNKLNDNIDGKLMEWVQNKLRKQLEVICNYMDKENILIRDVICHKEYEKEEDSLLRIIPAEAIKELDKELQQETVTVDVNTLIERYKQSVMSEENQIHILGMDKPKKLTDIYVHTKVFETVTISPRMPHEHDEKQDKKIAELCREHEITEKNRIDFIKDYLLSIFESKNRHTVILGDPGAGKTTIAKYLTVIAMDNEKDTVLQNAQIIPVFIDLGRYAQESEVISLKDYGTATAIRRATCIANQEDVFKEYIYDNIENGQILFILDGLDEVAKNNYDNVIKRINELKEECNNCPVIITCRIFDYKDDLKGVNKITVAKFDKEDREAFINNWFTEKDEKESFMKKLENNVQAKELGTNPLLLSLMAIMHSQRKPFSTKRIDLFRQCIDVLFRKWDEYREINREPVFDEDEKNKLLAKIAFHIHTREQGNRREIDKQDLKKITEDYINTLPLATTLNAEDIITEIASLHGILKNIKYTDTYLFSHLAFQEYYTAYQIYLDRDEEKYLRNFLDNKDPHWREVILLMYGMQNKADKLLSIILEHANDPDKEDIFMSNLIFAGEAVSTGANIDKSMFNQVIESLLDLISIGYSLPKILEISLYSILKDICPVKNLERFVIELNDKYSFVRDRAAEALGNIGKADDNVIQHLIQALNDQDDSVRISAAEALGKIGKADDIVIQRLIQALNDQNPLSVRISAAGALGNIGKADDTVIQALLHALNDQEKFVRSSAAGALGNIGKADDNIIQALIQALNDQNDNVIISAALALGKIGKADDNVIQALIQALNDQNDNVIISVAEALGKLEKADDNVIQALIQALNDQDDKVRTSAVYALGNIGKADDNVIQHLIQALNDQDDKVRTSAVYALGKIGKADDNVIQALIQAFNDQNPLSVRISAASALGKLGKADDNVIQALIQALNDESINVCFSAFKALGNIEKADDNVIHALIQALNDKYSFVRDRAAEALGNIGKADDNVIQHLIQALNDQDDSVRISAAEALGKIGKADNNVIQALIQALNDQNDSVRSIAALALGNMGKADDNVLQALILSLNDQYSIVPDRSRSALYSLYSISDRPDLFKLSYLRSLTDLSPLDSIKIKGFKSIKDIDLQLDFLNVFIGPNGAGKSNFISVFTLLHNIVDGNLGQFVEISGGAEFMLHYGSRVTSEMDISLSFGGNDYHCNLIPTEDDRLIFAKEEYSYLSALNKLINDESSESQYRETRLKHSANTEYITKNIRNWSIYHFHDTTQYSLIKKKSRIDDNKPLKHDASNLAAFLYYLQQRHPEHYKNIVGTINMVAPFFDNFKLEPDRLNPELIKLEWQEKGSDLYFDANSLSDGTLRFIALATLLMQPELPSMILLDEPELGLHPFAINLLGGMLRSASTKSQIIISTQSVSLINQFDPEHIVVAERVKGESVFKRLNKEELEVWLEDYTLGEIWEKNLIGGRP